ncbi:MAG: STAS-like domain-containing protein [Nitrospinae bacterium]|nr:STAS-like domain-containing protein [Nitrospinota bacterium]
MKIVLADSIGTHCSSIDDGQIFFKQVYPELKEGRSVEVDFKGVESILTPFLHNSIGRFLEYFDKEAVMKKLVLCNISQEQLKQVNNYIDRTDQKQFQDDSRETLMELFEEDELSDSGMQ